MNYTINTIMNLKKLKKIPLRPGVYMFKDAKGQIIYIGKAVNLAVRVGSYFKSEKMLSSKTAQLVKSTEDISYILVESEVEALVLEAELIKKFQPKYNIALKDDKSFRCIQCYKDRIFIVRERNIVDKDSRVKTFGPFPYGGSAEFIVKTLRKIFLFRDCSGAKFTKYHNLERPCLYGHTKFCPAPCISQEGALTNIENIKEVIKILTRNKKGLIKRLEDQMGTFSKNLDYEKAKIIRDQIYKLQNMSYENISLGYMENPNLLIDRVNEELKDLEKMVGVLCSKKAAINRIEFYDISNISGKWPVGSMVVSESGLMNKSQYRRFKIKGENTRDDVHMLQEILVRRIKHADWPKPDLIVLDGGKAQLSGVNCIQKFPDIPVLALAKKRETILFYDKKGENFVDINLPRGR